MRFSKIILFFLPILFPMLLAAEGFPAKYYGAKETFAAKTNIDIGMSASFTAQHIMPGRGAAVYGYYYPYLSYKPFTDSALGSGEFYFSFEYVHYFGANASALRRRAGLATDINYYPGNWHSFDNFYYAHTLPGRMSWLTVTAGQYSVYSIDGTAYTSDMQRGLINWSLSQSGSAAYPTQLGIMAAADLGGGISIMTGWQDAHNTFGEALDFSTMFSGKYFTFAAMDYEQNGAHYNVLLYHVDAVEDGLQSTKGWSFNAAQDFGGKYVVFGRANGISGEISSSHIRRSYTLGFGYKDPLGRNDNDIILLGGAFNQLSAPEPHKTETVAELAWVWGITEMFTITPDIQVYAGRGKTAIGLRTAFFF